MHNVERDRERETDRQTDRQKERERERHRDRKTERCMFDTSIKLVFRVFKLSNINKFRKQDIYFIYLIKSL